MSPTGHASLQSFIIGSFLFFGILPNAPGFFEADHLTDLYGTFDRLDDLVNLCLGQRDILVESFGRAGAGLVFFERGLEPGKTGLCVGAKRLLLPGNQNGCGDYAQDLIADDTLDWVRAHKNGPFFLFHAVTPPHGRFEIDDPGIYKNKDWTERQKNYAAMVTRLDSDVGRLLDLLKPLKIDKNTIVFFSGDNGSSFSPNSPIGKKFNQTMGGKLRGFKRSMYEGGLRQAAMVRWPGKVPAGRVTDEPWAFWDFLPTAAALWRPAAQRRAD